MYQYALLYLYRESIFQGLRVWLVAAGRTTDRHNAVPLTTTVGVYSGIRAREECL